MTRRPNILFLFPDQHRFDYLGVNPDVPVRTPNIDALARRGIRFDKVVCSSPLGAPSRACLASGRRYHRCGVAGNECDYPLEHPTYYQHLRDAGYHVCGVGKFDLHKSTLDWELDGTRLISDWASPRESTTRENTMACAAARSRRRGRTWPSCTNAVWPRRT